MSVTTATTQVTPRQQAYLDIFTTAIEGGVGYWSTCDSYVWTGEDGHEDPIGFHATIRDAEDEDSPTYLVNREKITAGVQRYIEWAKDHTDEYLRRAAIDLRDGHWDNLDIDATIADCIVQFGLFEKLVYG